MKKMCWLVALAFVATVGFTGSSAFAQGNIEDTAAKLENDPANQELRGRLVTLYYKQGVEDLQNNLDAEAAQALEKGLEAAFGGTNPIASDADSVKETRYALGYAHARQGRHFNAVEVLDELVAVAPEMISARYLLGVSLIRSMTNENILRGMEVLKQMARENEGDTATIAMNSSARLIYNFSTIDYAGGEAQTALEMISDLLAKYGNNPAPSKSENQDIKFAVGVYLMASGDLDGAQFELDYLALKSKDYSLASGVTLTEIRSNLYYQAALNRLQEGGKDGGNGALAMMKQADKLGGGNKAANHHVKALAHELTGNAEKAAEELAAVASADPDYAARIVR